MRRALLPSLFVLLPVIIVSALLLPMGATIKDCAPIYDDEIHHWNEVAVFRHCGFRGGYTTVDEKPAMAGWCHFGPHGPGFSIIYGSLARLFGWRPWSGPAFNVLFLGFSSLVWAWSTGFDTKVLKFSCYFIATSWPLLLYLPTTMQEPLHASFAILIASGIKKKYNWSTFAVIVIASLVRVTWALVLIPWVTLFIGETEKKTVIKLSAVAVCSVFVLFLTSRYVASPFPGFATEFFSHVASLVSVERDIRQTIIPNLLRFPFEGKHLLDEIQRIETINLIVVGLVGALYKKQPYLFVCVSLICILIPVAALYPFNSYRILYPHLLLACLVLLSFEQFEIIKILIIVHLALCLRFFEKFGEAHSIRVRTPVTETLSRADYIYYDPNAADGYTNTILVPEEILDRRWLSLPPGIGISTMIHGYVRDPKSKYVFLPPQATSGQSTSLWLSPAAMKEMELLCETGRGSLYVKRNE
jgi:hypothetical protein